MNSFYSTIYGKFAELQISESDSARFAYPISNPLPLLKVGRKLSDCVIGVPAIRLARGTISYGPFTFEDNEFGQVASVKLIIASIVLLSAKSIFRWLYKDYFSEWLSQKEDQLRAKYAMNILLDVFARQRIRRVQGQAFYNDVIRTADLASILLLTRASNDYPVMAQSALTSFLLNVPVFLPTPIMRIIRAFTSELAALTTMAPKMAAELDERIFRRLGIVEPSKKLARWGELSTISNSIYKASQRIPGRWHNIYLPYSHPISEKEVTSVSIYQNRMITAKDFEKLRLRAKDLKIRNEGLWEETFFEFVREANFMEKIKRKLVQAAKNLNFSEVVFPVCDYVSFSKLHAEISPDIRKMSDRARMVKSAFDENAFQEVGNLDLQLAIQAIASESSRTDVFTRDEELSKDETWTILVDSSKSLGASVRDLKAVSICLAETAHSILGSNPWGMFAFSDELYCIKDFAERYDNQVKARIGGLRIGGLSYIPDAIRTCSNLVKGNSRGRNFMILVSDGAPSGYSNVENEFGVSVRELKSLGITLIAIGLNSTSIKKTVRSARIIHKPSEITKEFMQVYSALSY